MELEFKSFIKIIERIRCRSTEFADCKYIRKNGGDHGIIESEETQYSKTSEVFQCPSSQRKEL